MTFRTMLLGHRDDHTKQRITEALDRMDHKGRMLMMEQATGADQQALWDLFEGEEADADFFVPSGTDPLKEVIHHGKNTLPAHNFFQKRFCLADDESGDLWGYNHQTLDWATGPGYYVAHSVDREKDKEAPSEFVINYTKIPPKKPESWPVIIPNEKKLGRFVYAGMKDYMRKVSEHISIGRAYKGKPMSAWFMLCREDPAEE
ncbi:MAG: hypothetical protein R3B07_17450 [Polyangiaceae bacterium]